jgi:hypothetical protein
MPQLQLVSTPFAARTELVDFYTRVESPSHPGAMKLLDYWSECMAKGDGFVVGRDIPARPIASLLQNVIVAEPLLDGSDMRLRVTGAAVRRRFVGTTKGHYLSEFFPPGRFALYRKCINEFFRAGQPIVFEARLGHTGCGRPHAEIVLMPVTASDRSATWLLAGVFYFD